MKSLFLFISLLFVSTSFAQKLLPERDVRQQVFAGEKFFKLYTTDEPLDGAYKVVMSGGAYYEATLVLTSAIMVRVNSLPRNTTRTVKTTVLGNITTIKENSYPSKITRMESLGANGNSGMTMPRDYSQNLITKAKKITPCAYIMIMANYPKNILTKKAKKMALKSTTKEKAICKKNF